MQTKLIGECPRCKVVTGRTSGYCESQRCLPGESELEVKPCHQWRERYDESQPLQCAVCGEMDEPFPLHIQPLRACNGGRE
jgi:hypothetical protein